MPIWQYMLLWGTQLQKHQSIILLMLDLYQTPRGPENDLQAKNGQQAVTRELAGKIISSSYITQQKVIIYLVNVNNNSRVLTIEIPRAF